MSETKEAEKAEEAKVQEVPEKEPVQEAAAEAEKQKEQPTKGAPEEKPVFTTERDYVVNLRRVYWGRKANRSKRAVRLIREFVARHMHTEELVLDRRLNEALWSRGIEKPPRRVNIHVGVTKEKRVYVYLKEDNGHSE